MTLRDWLQDLVAQDPGNRGIGPLVQPGDLRRAAASLAERRTVLIATGFPVPLADGSFRPETDGPLGAFALIHALHALSRAGPHTMDVSLVTGPAAFPVIAAAARSRYGEPSKSGDGMQTWQFPLPEGTDAAVYHGVTLWSVDELGRARTDGFSPSKHDALVAIECVGPSADGQSYNMAGIPVRTDLAGGLGVLFSDCVGGQQVTIGVGDGGNEIGMGKVEKLVHEHVKHGERIACTIATDELVVAGTSNWGGHALARAVLDAGGIDAPADAAEHELSLLEAMVAAGAVDGVTKRGEATVDGLSIEGYMAVVRAIYARDA